MTKGPFGAAGLAEHWLAAIVASCVDAIISKDLDGVITSWNQGAERIFGFAEREMLGTSITRLIPPDRLAEETRILAAIRRGELVLPFETVRLTRDRGSIPVSLTVSPITDASGRIVGASKMARDITSQKEQEREIARLSRLYAALSRVNHAILETRERGALLDAICRVLVETGEFRVAWIGWHSAEAGRLIPVASCGDHDGILEDAEVHGDGPSGAEELAGRGFRDGCHYISRDIERDFDSPRWRSAMARWGVQSAAVFPLSERGAVRGMLSVYSSERDFMRDRETALLAEVARDVSFGLGGIARDEDLRKSEELFRTIFRQAGIGIALVDINDGRIMNCNPALAAMLGFSVEALCGMTVQDVSEPDDYVLDRAQWDDLASGQSDRFRMEKRYRHKDGRLVWGMLTVTMVRDERGAPLFIIGMAENITDRKRAESAASELRETLELKVVRRTEELQSALVRAEAADRVKSAFLATMSHELRTPMNAIIGFTGILLGGAPGPLTPEQRKQLGMVRGSAHHLLALINDILDLSKIEAGQLDLLVQPFAVRDVLDRSVETVRPLAEQKGIALRAELSPRLGELHSDARRLEQIVLNLLSNAIKFTEAGTVTLEAEPVRGAPSSTVPAAGDTVRIRVRDTGIGIREEHLGALFQPFHQIDAGLTRRHEGTGLGLAICRRLTALLQGEITVRSEWGRGSEFTLILPRRLAPDQ